jgi:Methyltransferase domain
MGPALYDRIGTGYTATRREDPRLAAAIHAALGDASSVANIGAGTGSYEPLGLDVVAVEPSEVMRAQRPAGAAAAVAGSAERIPLADGSVDAAMAVLSDQHWTDCAAGLAEMRRVARGRVVALTMDYEACDDYWMVRDYLPERRERRRIRGPNLLELAQAGGGATISPVSIPADCRDGFFLAYWRRPHAYLDPVVRAGISAFRLLDPAVVGRCVRQLGDDLERGRWQQRHGHLLALDTLDLGLRLVVWES